MLFSGDMTPRTDKISRHPPISQTRRPGGKMSPESLVEMERARAAWLDNPGASLPRVAHIIGVPKARLEKWVQRGHVIPGTVGDPELAKIGLGGKVVMEKVDEVRPHFRVRAQKKHIPQPEPAQPKEYDGPVPTIEELRIAVKKKIFLSMDDPDSVSKYSQALRALDSVRKEESEVDEEEAERVRIYVPEETRSP